MSGGSDAPAESKPAMSSNLVVAMWAGSNVVLSVSLVTINKIVMKTYGFTFVLSLTLCHFIATTVFLEGVTQFKLFGSSVKHMETKDNWLTAFCGVLSIAFMNFSLQANSVGFYQITKLCIIPVVLGIEYAKSGKTVSYRVLISLGLLLAGVGIATVTDIQLNMKGCMYAVIAVLTTAQFQLWQGSKQKQHGLSAIQITHSIALPQTLITLASVVVVEPNVTSHTFSSNYVDVALIVLTCLIAMVMNVTSFGLIGKTSAVTFQVVGHAKTCLIIASGFIFFPPAYFSANEIKNLFGLFVAILGMVLYGHIKTVDQRRSNGDQSPDCLDSLLPDPKFKAAGASQMQEEEEIQPIVKEEEGEKS
mmetsp:Transcript_22929/g.74773  ORF Transcript_22929/g.74773 Transcript_22929/m.74773 type:complete len:362 (-) Transcript_22929:70-1155(-)